MSLSAIPAALSRLSNASRDFVLQMFAFEGMYERKAIYVRHRLPDQAALPFCRVFEARGHALLHGRWSGY